MFIAITRYRTPASKDIRQILNIASHIDHLLIRTPMPPEETSSFLDALISAGFPREKIIIHSDIGLLEAFDLPAIHFREYDEDAFEYKRRAPGISVSMSTHSARSIESARAAGLDFVLFGHIFESASKQGLPPRSGQEIMDALAADIPVVALGGINARTVQKLPKGFSGIAAISYFMDADPSEIKALGKEWELLNLM
ncbi:thiamine phosphate synthase [Lacicoccus alkaliphilus]|uniref:Thiazole tautomerase (Transcriptional regulator TenI) n=1 Tax=Lacicoccus alkaliphilus DSM 16010 TaxID=1123231 RepID=A0A1M7IV94_9BACL|nr:thiamine phosphate synthase [Salinicoccus alkaliphilus]SHM44267.1 thiazole tautomerase (transcriptional regulator TenI) [Salinicoccus alkaliphilus DSM 16010]